MQENIKYMGKEYKKILEQKNSKDFDREES